jgi:DNA uptake protein ComE-like DNA-binding protein
MALTRLLTASAVATLLAAQALAQTAPAPATTQPQRPATTQVQPAQPQRPATTPPAAQAQPAQPQPAQPQRPATSQATPPAAGQAQGQRVNLNTASASELDSLPQIGAARAQAILAERAKGRFRDWADFERRMAGTAVNQTALNAIKDRVRF